MATMNVSLPDPIKKRAKTQARTGRYSNASDYVRELIWHDQETRAAHDGFRATSRLVCVAALGPGA
ncbi:hypothetical protein AA19596_2371 [Acetobacter fabarum DSM 19596]|nr:hypothetical protein AA19596_2371 [Acetobacter fabarum DSM 19596]